MSEIDHIFSFKEKKKPSSTLKSVEEYSSKTRPLPETVVTSADLPGPSKRRKKDSISSKKRPLPENVVDTSADLPGPSKRRKKDSISSKNRPLPETVVDTSADLIGPSKRRKKDGIPNNSKPTKSKKSREPTAFGDSRGSGDRRKTEEGWSVYKEAELGLNNKGGDTPSCPFDCNCCF